MLSDTIINQFNEFKKKTGKYKDLDLKAVSFNEVSLGNKDYFTLNPRKTEIDKELIKSNLDVSFVPLRKIDPISGTCDLSISKPINELIHSYTYFAEGDVIFTKVTPSMENGNIAIAENLKNGIGFGSSEYYIFRSNKVHNRLLWHFMRQQSFKDSAKLTMKGAGGLKRVPKEFFDTKFIAIPENLNEEYTSIKIQDAIADFLDHQREQTGELKKKMFALQDKVNDADKAVLYKVFKMQDLFIINQFNKWATLKSYKLDGNNINCDIKNIFKEIEGKLEKASLLGLNHDDVKSIEGFSNRPEIDKNLVPIYGASLKPIGYIPASYNQQKLISSDADNPDFSFATDGNTTAGSSFIIHSGRYYLNNTRKVIKFPKKSNLFYGKYLYYSLLDMKKKYGFDRNIKATSKNLEAVAIDLPNGTKDYSSYEIQKIMVEFIEVFNLWKSKILDLTNSVLDKSNTVDSVFISEIFKGNNND